MTLGEGGIEEGIGAFFLFTWSIKTTQWSPQRSRFSNQSEYKARREKKPGKKKKTMPPTTPTYYNDGSEVRVISKPVNELA